MAVLCTFLVQFSGAGLRDRQTGITRFLIVIPELPGKDDGDLDYPDVAH
jgi:hypothetical protein